jgi:UDP-glucose 6-dehydrogenase
MLRSGRTPIYEPRLEDLMAQAQLNLSFSVNFAEAIPARTSFS